MSLRINAVLPFTAIAVLTFYANSSAAKDPETEGCEWGPGTYTVSPEGGETPGCGNGNSPGDPPPSPQQRLRIRPINDDRFAMPALLRFRMRIGPLPTGALNVPAVSITAAEPNLAVNCPAATCSNVPPYGPMRRSIDLAYSPESHRVSLYEQMSLAETVNPTLGSVHLDLPIESLATVASGTYAQIDVEYIYQNSNLTMKLCSVANGSVGAVCSENYYSSTQYYGFGSHTPDLLLGTHLHPHPQISNVRYCKFSNNNAVSDACDIPPQ